MSEERLILPKLKTNYSAETSRSHLIECASSLSMNNYSRNEYTDNSKLILELNDQIRRLRNEINYKDNLINELKCTKDIEQLKITQLAKLDAIFSVERSSADIARSELAGVVAQQESIENQINQSKIEIEHRDLIVNELKKENENLKSELSSLRAVKSEQHNKIYELHKELGNFETIALKSSRCMTNFEDNYRILEVKNAELESIISTLKAEKEEILHQKALINSKMSEFAAQFVNLNSSEINVTTLSSLDSILTESRVTINEFNQNKLELAELKAKFSELENESKTNREMIDQLVVKLNLAEKDAVEAKIESENYKQELNKTLAMKIYFEKETESLKERYSETNKLWLNSIQLNTNNDEKNQKYQSHLCKLKQDVQNYKSLFEQFKLMIASLLSDDFVKVEANDEDIKQKLNLLMVSSKDRGLLISAMESKIKHLNCQLTEEMIRNKELNVKLEEYITKLNETDNEIKSMNAKQNDSVNLCSNLKSDRDLLYSFVEKFASIIKVDLINSNLEETLNILIQNFEKKQIEQEKKIELNSIDQILIKASSRSESKIRSLEEQLASKEINLELLRKKLVELEEVKYGRSEIKKTADELVLKIKQQSVKIDNLNQQVAQLKADNILLKSNSLDVDALKLKNIQLEEEIKKLKSIIDQLESLNDKNLVRIGDLREEIDTTNKDYSNNKTSSDQVISQLSKELRVYKQDLEKTLQRERKLLDFRHAVALALGFNVNTLTLGDYEIISRIESNFNRLNTVVIGHTHPLVSTTCHIHN